MVANPPLIKFDPALVARLNELIEHNIDSEAGYRIAADHMSEAQYRKLLNKYADQRHRFVEELRHLLQQGQETPVASGTLTRALREGWLNLKVGLDSSAGAIFAECVRADERVISAYQAAFGEIIQEPLLALLRPQFTAIRIAYERVKALSAALNR